ANRWPPKELQRRPSVVSGYGDRSSAQARRRQRPKAIGVTQLVLRLLGKQPRAATTLQHATRSFSGSGTLGVAVRPSTYTIARRTRGAALALLQLHPLPHDAGRTSRRPGGAT